ncbi:MAG: deoxyguanosinetriphosphate triphosphohydrolase [candidate division Zixibacteria bacterium]|nr:deoxyguanosinetriphosphate triphosphohydrolase [candidate division Zixibacteria bacterium]
MTSLIERRDIEHWEQESLAPYAAHASSSRGRVYPHSEHHLRTAFQRDRDRIIHSAAFRRMEYKTQVFLPHEADHFRTRLTHTIEVAQVSRTLARNLRLNEDLTEGIALAHDLGHTPFGHAGEDILNELLAGSGGFNHNRQSLRVVDLLEQRYAEHPGLNLSYEVREGIAKHETSVKVAGPEFEPNTWPTLEASLVDRVDEITYNAHDVDDGVSSGLITLAEMADLSIWRESATHPGLSLTAAPFAAWDNDLQRRKAARFLIDTVAVDLLDEICRRIERLKLTDIDSVRLASEPVCVYTEAMGARVRELKSFLGQKLYRHPHLRQRTDRAREIVRVLYERFMGHPEQMPERFQEMLLTEKKEIVIADYIAGMTDRFAERLFDKG